MRLFAAFWLCGLLASSVLAAPQQHDYAGYLSSPISTSTAPPIHQPAQVHYVNIGQELNGDYKFGYDTGKGPSGQSFREETRLPDGTVKGQYGYLDAQNKMRIVKYTAGLQGFQIDSDSALNKDQLAASRPSHPIQPAPQPQQAPAHSQYYQPQSIPKPPAYQGLASAASSQPASIAQYSHPSGYNTGAYVPPSPQQSGQYTGYAAAPQAYAPNYSVNPSIPGYPQRQLTPDQLRQQVALNARSRQAALARQQQQEAHIRQQQQAATEAILAQQKAAAESNAAAAQAQAQAAAQAQYSSQRYAPQQQYAPAPQQQYAPQHQHQPQYAQQYQSPQQYTPQQYQSPQQYTPQQYQSPVTASAAAAAISPAASAQQSYGPKHTVSEMKPDLLSNFIQLPGVKLIQLDRKPSPKSASSYPSSSSYGLTAGPGDATAPGAKPEDEYQGPVVINAALLSYNIGANQPSTPPPAKAAKA